MIGRNKKKEKHVEAPPQPQTIVEMTELRWFALRIIDSQRHARDIYALLNRKGKVFVVGLDAGNQLIPEPVLVPPLEQVESLKPARLKGGTISAAPPWLEDRLVSRVTESSVPSAVEGPSPGELVQEVPMPSLIGDVSTAGEEDEDTSSGSEDSGADGEGAEDVQREPTGQA